MRLDEKLYPDPEIGAALRMIDGEVPAADVDWESLRGTIVSRAAFKMIEAETPAAEVDWESLRSSIVTRAEMPLARRRSHSARINRWMRPLVPLAAAASIAMGVWVTDRAIDGSTGESEALMAPGMSAEDFFQAELTEQEFQGLVSGSANADALLMVAVGGSESEG